MKEEEIEKAAEEYIDQFVPESMKRYKKHYKYCGTPCTLEDVYEGFYEGVEWTLEHQWRDITKELPPYEVPVLVHRDDGIYLEMRYDKNKVFNPCLDEYGFDIDDKGFNNEARFWMSIPNLRK